MHTLSLCNRNNKWKSPRLFHCINPGRSRFEALQVWDVNVFQVEWRRNGELPWSSLRPLEDSVPHPKGSEAHLEPKGIKISREEWREVFSLLFFIFAINLTFFLHRFKASDGFIYFHAVRKNTSPSSQGVYLFIYFFYPQVRGRSCILTKKTTADCWSRDSNRASGRCRLSSDCWSSRNAET